MARGVASWPVAQQQRRFVVTSAAYQARRLFLVLKREQRRVVAEPVGAQLTVLHFELVPPSLQQRY